MNVQSRLRTAPQRAGIALTVLLWLLMTIGTQAALAQGTDQKAFDHLKTGFALTGNHVQVRCESCHQNGIFKGTPRDCASCHVSGMRFARGNVVVPQQHLPTQQTCDSCHTTRTFVGAKFNHTGVAPGSCQTCHNGNLSSSKPSGHIQTSASCDSCHRTNAWSPAVNFDHAGVVAGTCATCHGAGRATGKSAQHMPTNANQSCDSCHRGFSSWRPTAWNHTQMVVTAQCATCHSGAYPPADGRPANHVPFTSVPAMASANCDACHKGGFSTWSNGRVHANFSVSTGCASCHSGAYLSAVGKPNNATHATVTGNCESCHRSTATWSGARVDHSTFTAATNCASCHNGTAGTGRPSNHIPIGAAGCFACHNVSPALWTPTKWTHTQVPVTAQCASCHTGSYPPADGRPVNHIPYLAVPVTAAANCDGCHRGSFTSWANGRLHSYYSLSTNCSTCHTGAYLMAVGKPNNATHATVTGNCESCHRSTTSWNTVTFAHSPANAVGTGTCDTCHNGTTATGKPGAHIPIPAGAARCDSCHRSQASFRTAMTMNHSVVTTAQCRTCHNGTYVSQGPQGALAKPVNHIPETQLLNGAAMDCNACHTSTTAWTTMTMNHNVSLGNGAGWCRGCHLSGTSFLGPLQRRSLSHYERYAGQTDCSSSGCHRPLGTTGTSGYRNWTN